MNSFLTVNITLSLLFLCGSAVSVGILDLKSKGLFMLWTYNLDLVISLDKNLSVFP